MPGIRQFLFGDETKPMVKKSEFLTFSFYLFATAFLMCVYATVRTFYGWQPAQESMFYVIMLIYAVGSCGMVYHSANKRRSLIFFGVAFFVVGLLWYSVNRPMGNIPVVRVYHDTDQASSWFQATMWWLSLCYADSQIFRYRNNNFFYTMFWAMIFGFWFGSLVWAGNDLIMFSCGIFCLAASLVLVWLFVKKSNLNTEECKDLKN